MYPPPPKKKISSHSGGGTLAQEATGRCEGAPGAGRPRVAHPAPLQPPGGAGSATRTPPDRSPPRSWPRRAVAVPAPGVPSVPPRGAGRQRRPPAGPRRLLSRGAPEEAKPPAPRRLDSSLYPSARPPPGANKFANKTWAARAAPRPRHCRDAAAALPPGEPGPVHVPAGWGTEALSRFAMPLGWAWDAAPELFRLPSQASSGQSPGAASPARPGPNLSRSALSALAALPRRCAFWR